MASLIKQGLVFVYKIIVSATATNTDRQQTCCFGDSNTKSEVAMGDVIFPNMVNTVW